MKVTRDERKAGREDLKRVDGAEELFDAERSPRASEGESEPEGQP